MGIDRPHLDEWIGKTETRTDRITPAPMAALSATLDRDDPYPSLGDPLPPPWHWLYFLPHDRQSNLGPEGHAKGGDFMPPTPLPRRMWAGGRLRFHHPLRVGDSVTRESRILNVVEKTGRTGRLLFVVVRHGISNDGGIAVTEEHDIVYRGHAKPDAPQPESPIAPARPTWERRIELDDVLLFRYSALTFNAHRIHYDRRYATEVEGYPGLVVHGPLVATLLLDLVRTNLPGSMIRSFEFRAIQPLFDLSPFRVCGHHELGNKEIELWASNEAGQLAVTGRALTE